MDNQEISTFVELYTKFQESCKHIASILSEYDCYFNKSWLRVWCINYDGLRTKNKSDCYTDNYVFDISGRIETRTVAFPIELLSATDDQIHQYALENVKDHDDVRMV
jgi:hypothetical protein